jgi:hypothetical protein
MHMTDTAAFRYQKSALLASPIAMDTDTRMHVAGSASRYQGAGQNSALIHVASSIGGSIPAKRSEGCPLSERHENAVKKNNSALIECAVPMDMDNCGNDVGMNLSQSMGTDGMGGSSANNNMAGMSNSNGVMAGMSAPNIIMAGMNMNVLGSFVPSVSGQIHPLPELVHMAGTSIYGGNSISQLMKTNGNSSGVSEAVQMAGMNIYGGKDNNNRSVGDMSQAFLLQHQQMMMTHHLTSDPSAGRRSLYQDHPSW